MSDQSRQEVDDDVADDDVRNGEPAATDDDHLTGEAQAAENEENDPPA